MAADIANNYASVLFDMNLDKEQVETMRELMADADLSAALVNPLVRKNEKHTVIEKLFPQSVWSFVKVMSDNDDVSCAADMFEAYDAMVRLREETVQATYTYVTEPDDAQIEKLKAKIARDYGKKAVKLELVKDPSIIGGFVLTVEDQVLDQSVKTSMSKLKRHFTER